MKFWNFLTNDFLVVGLKVASNLLEAALANCREETSINITKYIHMVSHIICYHSPKLNQYDLTSMWELVCNSVISLYLDQNQSIWTRDQLSY